MLTNENEDVINDIVALRTFIITLEWVMALMKRFSCPLQFDLVQIEYGSNNELSDTYGALDACHQLVKVTASLKKAFRETDIVARTGTTFWILAPYTYDDEKICDKILNIVQRADHHGLNIVDREISIYPLPISSVELTKLQNKALDLLEHLKLNKQGLASHTFRLPANH